jgi:hypothetical protein
MFLDTSRPQDPPAVGPEAEHGGQHDPGQQAQVAGHPAGLTQHVHGEFEAAELDEQSHPG